MDQSIFHASQPLWDGFISLTRDSEGVKLFQSFLEENSLEHMLDFWFAVNGFKEKNEDHFRRLLNKIYRVFINNKDESKSICLSEETRKKINAEYFKFRRSTSSPAVVPDDQTNSSIISQYKTIFDVAQQEVESKLSGPFYKNFCDSPIYINYFNSLQASIQDEACSFADQCHNRIRPDDHCSMMDRNNNSHNVDFSSDVVNDDLKDLKDELVQQYQESDTSLTTLIEDDDDVGSSSHVSSYRVNRQVPNKLSQKSFIFNDHRQNDIISDSFFKRRQPCSSGNQFLSHNIRHSDFRQGHQPPFPYHGNIAYATKLPNSERDSEISSSGDSYVYCDDSRTGHRRYGRGQNHRSSGYYSSGSSQLTKFKPQQPVKPENREKVEPLDCDKFAAALIEKLKKIQNKQQSERMFYSILNGNSSQRSQQVNARESSSENQRSNHNSKKDSLKNMLKNNQLLVVDHDSDQAILDNHCAQVFKATPNTATPNLPSAQMNGNIENRSKTLETVSRNHYPTASVDMVNNNSLSNQFTNRPGTNCSLPSSSLPELVSVCVTFTNGNLPIKQNMIGPSITLFSFKQQIPNLHPNQMYYFRRKCTENERKEMGSREVMENITEDSAVLPQCDGKIYAQVVDTIH